MKRWIAALIVLLCLFPFVLTSGGEEEPMIEHRRFGGIAGFAEHLEIFADGMVVYESRGSKVEARIEKKELESLVRMFLDASFLTRKSKSDVRMHPDRLIEEIVFRYQGKTNSVSEFSGDIGKIRAYLVSLEQRLLEDRKSGILRVFARYIIKKWPFSSSFTLKALSKNCGTAMVDREIFSYLRDLFLRDRINVQYSGILFLEDGIFRQVNITGYGLSYEEFKKSGSFSISGPLDVVEFPSEIRLDLNAVPRSGKMLDGPSRLRVKSLFAREKRWPTYYVQGKIRDGTLAYVLYLCRGER